MSSFPKSGSSGTPNLHSRALQIASGTGRLIWIRGVLSISSLRKTPGDNCVLSKKVFDEGLSFSNAVPGFILTHLAVFAGIRSVGAWGAVAAIVGAVLPASFLTVAATQLFLQFRDAGTVKAALQPAQPVTLGMLVVMVIRLAL
jgi:hypothetical protein